MNHDIFISYSSKQKSIADGVCHYLEENGFKCWVAPRDIPGGYKYGDCIYDAIIGCEVFVLVFSEAASLSPWVNGEIHRAFSNNKPILPFRIDETQVKGDLDLMLNQFHWIDAFPQYADRLPDLLSSICGLLGRQSRKGDGQDGTTKRSKTVSEETNQTEKRTSIINGHEFVDLGMPSGTLWATCNVGAAKPEDYGDYFAWGETRPKTEYGWNSYKYSKEKRRFFGKCDLLTKYCSEPRFGFKGFSDGLTVLQVTDDVATSYWSDKWQMPTEQQWMELKYHTKNIWTKINDVFGMLFMANNGNELFLPAAGFRDEDSLYYTGSNGHYWSSSLNEDDPSGAWNFHFGSDYWNIYYGNRYFGLTVRPVCSAHQN